MTKTIQQREKNPAKAFLSRYRALVLKCAAIERAINDALEGATNITVSLKPDKVQTSGSGERMAEQVIKAVDATAYLEEQRQKAGETMREIMRAISSVPDDIQQTVVIEKYINGRTLADIQNDIYYEYRNKKIIHGKALWNVWQYMKRTGIDGGY
jgi:DNA-directed RNA polymerase specialized sigma24 family protein